MGGQPGQYMMRILPHRLGDNQRRIGWNISEDLNPTALRIDEAVLFLFVERMSALDAPPFGGKSPFEFRLHLGLGGPTRLIRGQPEISARDEVGDFGLHE